MVDVAEWGKLAHALRELHSVLLKRARDEYEAAHAVTLSPGELLNKLTTDAEFAWLRSLSELMVDLDVIRDADAVQRDALIPAIRAAVEHVIAAPKPTEIASDFAQQYWPRIHADPHVTMAHAAVKQAINAWPALPQSDSAAQLHERHRLAEKARHLSARKTH